MKVDLEELRALVDGELQKVEQRRILLQEQLEHIEAVQHLAEETQPTKPEEDREPAPEGEEMKRGAAWFRQNRCWNRNNYKKRPKKFGLGAYKRPSRAMGQTVSRIYSNQPG